MIKNPENSPFYLYLFSCETYSNRTASKIGVSANPSRRLKQLGSRHGHSMRMYALWPMDRKDAFRIEAIVCKHFPKKRAGKEFLSHEPDDVLSFVAKEVCKK